MESEKKEIGEEGKEQPSSSEQNSPGPNKTKQVNSAGHVKRKMTKMLKGKLKENETNLKNDES